MSLQGESQGVPGDNGFPWDRDRTHFLMSMFHLARWSGELRIALSMNADYKKVTETLNVERYCVRVRSHQGER